MKKLLPFTFLFVLALAACGQSPQQLNNDGNEAFLSEDYATALAAYEQAQSDSPDLAEPHYNAASVHYRQEDYEQAQGEIEQALVTTEGRDDLSQHGFYNLGNVFFQSEQFETAIEAYKEALRLNPDDVEAKQNLELALRQLQQQQQEEQSQDQQEQENEQQQQDQQEQQQDSDQQQDQQEQQSEQAQENEQQQENDGEQHDEPSDQQQNEQQEDTHQDGQPQQIQGLTEEQARQLLEAASQGTESLEEFLQQIYVIPGRPPAEDW